MAGQGKSLKAVRVTLGGEASDSQPVLWEVPSAAAQWKLILPNRKEKLTEASLVTARQQVWYSPSRKGVIPKDTSCSQRPKWLSLSLLSGVIWLTHLAPDLTAGGQRTVLVRQHLNRSFRSAWVIARAAVDIHSLKSQKNNVSMQSQVCALWMGTAKLLNLCLKYCYIFYRIECQNQHSNNYWKNTPRHSTFIRMKTTDF